MAERKAVNKYYPPEWTPSKGSINKFRGSHPLRERARKLHQGILVIRFEMPFNIWCEGCGNHIGMGVRYNAEKSKTGMYYTTPIYKFRMKCHLCDNHFEIQTDPQNLDYVILCGARRQEGRWDPKQNEQVVPDDKDITKKLVTDAMFRLEHGEEDKSKKKSLTPTIAELEDFQTRWRDDYIMNKLLRQKFREKKSELLSIVKSDQDLLRRASLNLPLLPEDAKDAQLASLMKLTPLESFEDRQMQKRVQIESRPLFSSTYLKGTSESTSKAQKIIQNLQQQKMLHTAKNHAKPNLGIVSHSRLSPSQSLSSNKNEQQCPGQRLDLSTSSSSTSTTISLVSDAYCTSESEEENVVSAT